MYLAYVFVTLPCTHGYLTVTPSIAAKIHYNHTPEQMQYDIELENAWLKYFVSHKYLDIKQMSVTVKGLQDGGGHVNRQRKDPVLQS